MAGKEKDFWEKQFKEIDFSAISGIDNLSSPPKANDLLSNFDLINIRKHYQSMAESQQIIYRKVSHDDIKASAEKYARKWLHLNEEEVKSVLEEIDLWLKENFPR